MLPFYHFYYSTNLKNGYFFFKNCPLTPLMVVFPFYLKNPQKVSRETKKFQGKSRGKPNFIAIP